MTTDVVALSRALSVALLISGAVLSAVALGALLLRGRSRDRGPDIPPAMRPGPSDPALEAPLLLKLQGWGVLLVGFFVIWVPFVWLSEPSINLEQERDLKTQAIERGARSVELFSEENQLGVGCVRCHGPELRGGVILTEPLPDGSPNYAYPPDLTDVCGGPNTSHPLIKSVEDITTTIEQGRGAMPSWSIRYEGALDDQQIRDIVTYLIDLSSENVPPEQNVCLNADAAEAAASPSAAASGEGAGDAASPPAGDASASPSGEASP